MGWRFLLRMLGCRMWLAMSVDDGEPMMSLLQSMKISWRSFALLLFKLSFPLASIEPIFYVSWFSGELAKLFLYFLIAQNFLLFDSFSFRFFFCEIITSSWCWCQHRELITCFTRRRLFQFHPKLMSLCFNLLLSALIRSTFRWADKIECRLEARSTAYPVDDARLFRYKTLTRK